MKMSELQRHTVFTPGFDRRNPDPSKDYGISGGKFIFVVSGPLGAVHFVLGMNLYPASAIDHLVRHHNNNASALMGTFGPMGFDVGYHSPVPRYDDQSVSSDACEWLGGRPCYSDGSGLRADEWKNKFLDGGTEWLWPALEQEYRDRFDTHEVG